jgi:hypothetical protein
MIGSGFEGLPQAIDEGRATNPLEADQLAFSDQSFDDETALSLVVQNINVGEQFLQTKSLSAEWDIIDNLYRAYVTPQNWPNTNTPRAAMPMPVVMETIETLLPQTHMAFFSEPQPFELEPRGRTSPQVSRVVSRMARWAVDVSGFKEEMRKMQKSAFQYGICIGKWGWEVKKQRSKVYSQTDSGDIAITPKETDIAQPTFEWIDVRNVIVDPKTRNHDIRTSGWRIHQKFVTPDDLDKMRKDDTYKNIPSREEFKYIMAYQEAAAKDSLQALKYSTWRENQAQVETIPTTADPLRKPLEILELETDSDIITVLQRCIVIRNEKNDDNCCHYVSCAFIDVLNAFYGFGVSKLVGSEQRFQTGVLGLYTDSLSLKLQPVWQRKKGLGTKTQNITVAPGKVVNDDGELSPLEMESISQEALGALEASEARASRRVGANFGQEMPTQAMRTAEGVQSFTSGVQIKLQYFIDVFSEQVFIPVIDAFVQMCKDNLTPDNVKSILSDTDSQLLEEFKTDTLGFYNSKYSLGVLSSTKLAARKGMAAMIPMFMNLFGQPSLGNLLGVQAKKVDFVEFLEQCGDVTGWPMDDIIVDMTPEDQQRQAMSNPAVVNAQAKEKQQATDQNNKLEQIQAKGEASAGVQVIRHVLKGTEDEAARAHELKMLAKPLAEQSPKG